MTQNPASTPGTSRIVLGAMSGTSADGVDVAAVEITGRGLGMDAKYLGHVEHAYDAELRRRIFAIRESGECRLDELAALGRDITLAYAEATRELMGQLSLSPAAVSAVAAHGQTLYHAPPDSIQWLDPSLLAAKADLAVISDFRRADLAAGGQGAPLVPFADWILFRHPEKTRVILNLGGIANLTYLPAGGSIEDVEAFDTGPGMCISDWLMREHDPEGPGYDEGGAIALRGAGHECWKEFKADRYFDTPPPKSTDAPAMIARFKQTCLHWKLSLPDLVATAAFCTAITIEYGIHEFTNDRADEVFVAGGGASNAFVRGWLSEWYKGRVKDLDTLGLPAQARESVAFAILGAATLDGEPSNVPRATGAARRVVLGSVTPRPGT